MEAKTAMTKRGIAASWLKIIAVVTMLVDHTAATILERVILQRPAWGPVRDINVNQYYHFYTLLRGIGRMAFPIYCFLLVEGLMHTRNRVKYALRLFLFALVSEIPFDLAFEQSFFDPSYNNVFFTLLIGFLTIAAVDFLREHISSDSVSGGRQLVLGVGKGILTAAIILAGCAAAHFLHTDYAASGVLAICILYLFRGNRLIGFALAVFALSVLSSSMEIVALFMLIPLYFYDGTRGRQNKYFFYVFYPAHLLILSFLCYVLGLGI